MEDIAATTTTAAAAAAAPAVRTGGWGDDKPKAGRRAQEAEQEEYAGRAGAGRKRAEWG
jgi:hypothetical protein